MLNIIAILAFLAVLVYLSVIWYTVKYGRYPWE